MNKKMYMAIAAVLMLTLFAFSACGGNNDADEQEHDYTLNQQDENGDVSDDAEADDSGDASNQQAQAAIAAAPPRVEPPIIDWRAVPLASTFEPDPDSDFQREWAADIAQLRRHILWNHPYFANPAFFNLPESMETGLAFDALLNALLYQLPYLSEFEVLTEIQRANALFQTTPFQYGAFNMALTDWFPFWADWLDDGLYILSICVTLQHVLNHRIVGINGIPLDEVLDAAMPLITGTGEAQRRNTFAQYLRTPMFIHAIGLGDGRQITYNLVSTAGTAVDLTLHTDQVWGAEWMNLRAEDVPMPLYQTRDADVWHEYLEEYGILYFRFAAVPTNIPDINNVRRIAETYDLNAIVVDMRSPNTARSNIMSPSMRTMFNFFGTHAPEGRLFVLIDQNNGFYTGVESALHLESVGAILIGQQSLQFLEGFTTDWMDSTPAWETTLYYSDIWIRVPTRLLSMNLAGTTREFPDNALTPHIHVNAMTIEDWYYNRDFWMDVVFEQIGN